MLSSPGHQDACADALNRFQILPRTLGDARVDPDSQQDGSSSSAALSSSFINDTTHSPLRLANSRAITEVPQDFVLYF